MPTLGDVLSAPGLETLSLIAKGDQEQAVRVAALAADSEQLSQVGSGDVVMLTPALARGAMGYQLDSWCRTAAERGVALLILSGRDPVSVPRTALRVVERSELSLACTNVQMDTNVLFRDLVRAVDSGQGLALHRAARVAEMLADKWCDSGYEELRIEELCVLISEAGGLRVRTGRPHSAEIGAPVLLDGFELSYISVACPPRESRDLASVLLRLSVDAAERLVNAQRRAIAFPVRSRAQVLSELFTAGPQHLGRLAQRARALGLNTDGWHLVVTVELDTAGMDEERRQSVVETLGPAALRTAWRIEGTGEDESGPVWSLGYGEQLPLLVRTWPSYPGERVGQQVWNLVNQVREDLTRRMPAVRVRCGVGAPHENVDGLRSSWAEAKAALLGHARGATPDPVVIFDELGLHRMLVEWYTTHTARDSVHELLAPLESLGREKAEMMVSTLAAYLDQQGSISQTAAVLHMHRNAVSYRLKRIGALLEVDLSDPDARLAVHLACRAWRYQEG